MGAMPLKNPGGSITRLNHSKTFALEWLRRRRPLMDPNTQHVNSDVSAPPPGGFFLGFSMKWMLLLVLVVIGVGTLMGTTATPVM